MSPKILALAIASAFVAASAHARDEAVALTGTQAPGLPSGITFSSVGNQVINNSGRVAFTGILTGPGVDGSNLETIYADTFLWARTGSPAWSLPGVTYTDLSAPLINNGGVVGYSASLAGTGITSANDQAIYGSNIVRVRKGDQVPGLPAGVLFGNLESPTQINNNGNQVAFRANLSGAGVTSSNNLALFRDTTLLARTGNAAPGLPGLTFNNVFDLDINNVQAAYSVQLSGPGVTASNQFALYRDTTLLARMGDAAPGLPAGTVFGVPSFPLINNAGQVAFVANLAGPGVDASNGRAIYRDSTLVARVGDAPGLPPGMAIADFVHRGINDSGQVVFHATLAGPAVTSANDDALYRDTTLIARSGAEMPGLPAGAVFGHLYSLGAINNAGHVMATGILSGGGTGVNNSQGMWLGDGIEVVQILRTGTTLNGKTVNGFNFLGNQQLNDAGQVAYRAIFTDGSAGVFKFTPDLHWRQNSSGSWDNAPSWTLGIAPGAIYDLKIDPSASVTITGPAADRSVRTLELGGGSGIATLSLLGGKITPLASNMVVWGNGVLTGDGTIGGNVTNFGTVRAQNVTIEGSLDNRGLVTGSGRLNAEIYNNAGSMRVASGQSLRIGGNVNNYAGSVTDVIGGELETTGYFLNAHQLAARNAMLRFGGGLYNYAQVAMSFGTNDVFGDVYNDAFGRILVSGASNATFWHDVTNDGEIRASAGSAVVYFGVLSGTGSLTGAGTHFVEGVLAPGSSPGTLTATNLSLGSSSETLIEIAALDDFDHIHVSGDLVLDGTLIVSLPGFGPAAGNSFDILDWGTLTGTFATLNLPGLGTNLAWNTSRLYLDGTLSVAAIPEPGTYALLLAGLGLLGFAARRKIPPGAGSRA